MPSVRRRLAMLTLCAGVPACEEPAVDLVRERRAVADAVERLTSAVERRDWPAVAAGLDREATTVAVLPGGREWSGWEAIEARGRGLLSDTSRRVRSLNLRQEVRVSESGELAWVRQRDSLLVTTRGVRVDSPVWSTAVFVKRGGSWRLMHLHMTGAPPADEASPR